MTGESVGQVWYNNYAPGSVNDDGGYSVSMIITSPNQRPRYYRLLNHPVTDHSTLCLSETNRWIIKSTRKEILRLII